MMQEVGEYEYDLRERLGQGAFATVYKGRLRNNPEELVAIKCIDKKRIPKSQTLLSKEIRILKDLSRLEHENVVRLYDCKESDDMLYLIIEYCNGGDLSDYLRAKHILSEDIIARFVSQIAGAMEALTAKGIVHRDIKPHNLLLSYPRPDAKPTEIKIKIADFGFARFLADGNMAATLCGSPMYMAPEVLMSLPYCAKADLWSIGTIIYQCLTGNAPFHAETPPQLRAYYERNSQLTPKLPSRTSGLLKDLILRLLKRNASERLEFKAFFSHPFVMKYSRPKMSSPVVVPITRKDSSADAGSTDSTSTSSLQALSVSPLSMPSMTRDSPALKNSAAPASQQKDENGYVLVPKDCPADHKAHVADQLSQKTSQKKPRPKSAASNDGETAPVVGSAPLPVPARGRTKENSNLPNASPVRMRKLSKTESPRSRRSSESSNVDIGSLTPPNVTFAVGTPPSYPGAFTNKQRSNTDGSLQTMHENPPIGNPNRPQSTLPTSHSFSERSALSLGNIQRPSFAQEFSGDFNKENLPCIGQTNRDPIGLPYAQSPHNMEGPVIFAVPDLTEETLHNAEHRETLAKLQFVSSLVVSLIELAQSRSSPLLDSPNVNKLSGCIVFVSEKQRRMEQLVLYIRALHVLTLSLQLAKKQVTDKQLQPTNAVKATIKELNGLYHTCLERCKLLKSRGVETCGGGVDQQFLNNTADKLIYEHAIELCQLAALDEIHSKHVECVKRYKNAHTLLHGLIQMADLGRDVDLLESYKKEIEKRLIYLEGQGYCVAFN
ncbi:serine/threonine-protein kinase unc-51-like [Watersipora subatra]|uniref:serine/threonine-protein kinase unc-51-like n=1 Tax=Watersipora subatra TaxID=2589382 RepID=UPI00355BCA96